MSNEKNREQKEIDILEAVGRIFLRDGYQSLGINSIANEAGCSKVLIYRYFGGMDGILEAFSKKLSLVEVPDFSEKKSIEQYGTDIFKDQISRLRNSPLLREIMKWELVESNPLTDSLASERESSGVAIVENLKSKSSEDVAAWSAIISAGLNFLAIRSDTASEFCGINIESDEGWNRIENAVGSLLNKIEENNEN